MRGGRSNLEYVYIPENLHFEAQKNGGLVQMFLFSRVIFRFHVLIFQGVPIMDFFCHGRLSGFHPLPKFHVKREPKLGCNLQGEPNLSKQELHRSFLTNP